VLVVAAEVALQFRSDKIVYRRYAGLFFCVCVDSNDNELAYLEAIHLFVEVLGTFGPLVHPASVLLLVGHLACLPAGQMPSSRTYASWTWSSPSTKYASVLRFPVIC
jgi:hypothetical protein